MNKTFTFHSGGARGADTYWEQQVKKVRNATIKVHRPYHITKETPKEAERTDREYEEVVAELERTPKTRDTYAGQLMRRDMLQVRDCDAVFAIAMLSEDGYVAGGTGYSTTRAILDGKPVWLFAQERGIWMKWDTQREAFRECTPPVLTERACLVGSRDLRENGHRAIEWIIERTIKENN